MARHQHDEIDRQSAERSQREYVRQQLQMMVLEDLNEAIKLGLLTPEQAADDVIKTALAWKAERN